MGKKPKFYAVASGRKVGIFPTWEICSQQVTGCPGAKYKSFQTHNEAHEYMKQFNWDYKRQHENGTAQHNDDGASGSGNGIQDVKEETGGSGGSAGPNSSNQKSDNDQPVLDHYDALQLIGASEAKQKRETWTRLATARSDTREAKSSRGSKRSTESDASSIHSSKQPKLESTNFESSSIKGKGVRRIEVYTDGACPGNGRPEARAGWGVYWPESEDVDNEMYGKNESARVPGLQTNQRAELIAVIRALQLCPDKSAQLVIYTDSRYSMNAINEWQLNWRRNGWLTSTKEGVTHKGLIRRLEREMRLYDHRPILVKVKGHSGDKGNDEADKLAVKGASLPEDPLNRWSDLDEPSDSENESDERKRQHEQRVVQMWVKSGFTIDQAERKAGVVPQ